MKKSTKAVLLSALVFPGAVLAGTAFPGLYILVTRTVEMALQIAEKIQSGEVQPDVAAITELVSIQPVGTEVQLINIATAALILSWLIGIIDSYRVGRIQDHYMRCKPGKRTT